LSKEKAASHPVLNNYPPAVLLPYDRRDWSIELPKDKEMVMPGDNVSITVKLIARCHGRRPGSPSVKAVVRRRGVVAKILD